MNEYQGDAIGRVHDDRESHVHGLPCVTPLDARNSEYALCFLLDVYCCTQRNELPNTIGVKKGSSLKLDLTLETIPKR